MKKVFFIDIDGTITDATRGLSTISKKSEYALNELSKNHYVFISSGRCRTLLPDTVKKLKNVGFITTNGAYGEYQGKELFHKYMDEELIEKIREYGNKNNLAYIFEKQDEIIKGGKTELYDRFTHAWSMLAGKEFLDDGSNSGYYMAMMIAEDEEGCSKLLNDLGDILDIRRHYSFTSFDVNEYGINKGYGVNKILEVLNIPKEDSYAFGDEMNDFEMISEAGHGIVMGNGNPRLKEIAEEVCGDVLDDGLYHYLVNHGFIRPVVS